MFKLIWRFYTELFPKPVIEQEKDLRVWITPP